jgi:hypothetical protein
MTPAMLPVARLFLVGVSDAARAIGSSDDYGWLSSSLHLSLPLYDSALCSVSAFIHAAVLARHVSYIVYLDRLHVAWIVRMLLWRRICVIDDLANLEIWWKSTVYITLISFRGTSTDGAI